MRAMFRIWCSFTEASGHKKSPVRKESEHLTDAPRSGLPLSLCTAKIEKRFGVNQTFFENYFCIENNLWVNIIIVVVFTHWHSRNFLIVYKVLLNSACLYLQLFFSLFFLSFLLFPLLKFFKFLFFFVCHSRCVYVFQAQDTKNVWICFQTFPQNYFYTCFIWVQINSVFQ